MQSIWPENNSFKIFELQRSTSQMFKYFNVNINHFIYHIILKITQYDFCNIQT